MHYFVLNNSQFLLRIIMTFLTYNVLPFLTKFFFDAAGADGRLQLGVDFVDELANDLSIERHF